jgi:hypothetical protein
MGLWTRLEWVLSAAAAPLAVLWIRRFGVESGARATALLIALLCAALFELHQPHQWRLAALGRRLRREGRTGELWAEVWLALHGLPPALARGAGLAPSDDEEAAVGKLAAAGRFQLATPRVRAHFAEALAERRLDPTWVKLVLSTDVEVARTRDAGPFHLVELNPATAAGPTRLLSALFTHELAHVAARDPLVKRVLCGVLVPLCTLAAALSAGLIEGGRNAAPDAFALSVALLAAATLLPWAYASLQAVSFAMELRADREAARRLGAGPVFELLDCLDDGGLPYRLARPPQPRPPELVEGETNRLLEELLLLLPAHPPTWERRRRLLAWQRAPQKRAWFARDALPMFLAGSAPLLAAVALSVLAFELAGPEDLRPLHPRKAEISWMAPPGPIPTVAQPGLGCGPHGDPLCADAVEAAVNALASGAPQPQPGAGIK